MASPVLDYKFLWAKYSTHNSNSNLKTNHCLSRSLKLHKCVSVFSTYLLRESLHACTFRFFFFLLASFVRLFLILLPLALQSNRLRLGFCPFLSTSLSPWANCLVFSDLCCSLHEMYETVGQGILKFLLCAPSSNVFPGQRCTKKHLYPCSRDHHKGWFSFHLGHVHTAGPDTLVVGSLTRYGPHIFMHLNAWLQGVALVGGVALWTVGMASLEEVYHCGGLIYAQVSPSDTIAPAACRWRCRTQLLKHHVCPYTAMTIMD